MENLAINPQFWNGRRVFITGHTGFKGTWLVLWLLKLGAKVHGYSLAPETQPSMFEALGLPEYCSGKFGDVRNSEMLERELKAFSPEVIFHLAAQPLVRRSYRDPAETYATNVLGTVNVLNAARTCSDLRSIVNVTTDKCYENVEWEWGYRESDALGGSDPYSSSKACSELVTSAFRRSFFQNGAAVCSARAGNIIGGGDWSEDRLIPDAARSFASGKSVLIRNPASVRPWQHVIDCLNGYLLLAQASAQDSKFAGAWNFGPNPLEFHSVKDVISLFAESYGPNAKWHHETLESQPKESILLKLDPMKALQKLGWKTKLDIKTSVDMTARWYQFYYEQEPTSKTLSDFSLAQIEHFRSLK